MGIVTTHAWLNLLLTKVNPIAYLITSGRQALLSHTVYEPCILLVWFVISVLLVLLGIRLIYKNENTYIKVI